MQTLTYAAMLIALPFAIYLLLSFTAALAQVRRSGTSEARQFRLAGVTFERFRTAGVQRQDSGSLVPTRAGLSLRSTTKGLVVEETRTVAKDVF